jgi:hypothetical protein
MDVLLRPTGERMAHIAPVQDQDTRAHQLLDRGRVHDLHADIAFCIRRIAPKLGRPSRIG